MIDEIEILKRITELERKVSLIQDALNLFSIWMDVINDINDNDDFIFRSFNNRINKLELRKS